jgi:hypothetical protein
MLVEEPQQLTGRSAQLGQARYLDRDAFGHDERTNSAAQHLAILPRGIVSGRFVFDAAMVIFP